MPNEEKVENEKAEIGTLENEMDALLEKKPESEDGEKKDVEKNDSKGDGWLTSLPKELRDGVDTTRYSSLAEYIKDLRANQKTEPDETAKKKMEDEWTNLLGEAKKDVPEGFDSSVYDSLIQNLKAEGVDVVSAKKTLEAFSDVNRKEAERLLKKKDDDLSSYVADKWGTKAKDNMADAKKGLQVIFGENREVLQRARATGLSKDPAFLEVCRMLGSRSKEGTIDSTKSSGAEQKRDPWNPLNL